MARRNNGPKLRWLKKRNMWYIVWTENGRSRECSTGEKAAEQAEIKFAEWLRERQKTEGPRKRNKILITDILSDYIDERGKKVVDGQRLIYSTLPLIDYWQEKTLNAITRQSCEEYFDFRNRSAGTVRRELSTLRAAINHAVAENRLENSVKVHLPEQPPSKDRWLNKKEAAKLLLASLRASKARSYLPLFILIGLHTGQRKQAILSLRWSQVDLENGMIQWNPQGREQTKKRRPRARIPRKLLGHLQRAKQRGSDIGYVLHINGKGIKDLKKSFANVCKNADLKDVTPHTLRHTRATWGMQAGTPIWQLADFLGMSTTTLERVYAHHHPDYQKLAAENY